MAYALPTLLADCAACPGKHLVTQGRIEGVPCCTGCKRRVAFDDALGSHETVQGVTPAAEWSDTTNSWRCGNRLPMEG